MALVSPGAVRACTDQNPAHKPRFSIAAQVVSIVNSDKDVARRTVTARKIVEIAENRRGSFADVIPKPDQGILAKIVYLGAYRPVHPQAGIYEFCGDEKTRIDLSQLLVGSDGFLSGTTRP